MWTSLPDTGFGAMKSLDNAMTRTTLRSSLALSQSDALIVTSDYSGGHRGSTRLVYSLLIVASKGWEVWERERLLLRRTTQLGTRRMSFKGLNDAVKRTALVPFLEAADTLSGVCVSVTVPTRLASLFESRGRIDLALPDLSPYSHLSARVIERMLRVVHMVSFFTAGLSSSGQDVLWFTDADDIAANDAQVGKLTETWATVFSHYLQHDLRHIRCGTTRCDDGTLQIEDLASIPDLAAGALGEMLSNCDRASLRPVPGLLVRAPGMSRKARLICSWLARRDTHLDRLVFEMDRSPAGGLVARDVDIRVMW
jgi:hypothetical protein